MKLRKRLACFGLAALLSAASAMPAFAGEWQQLAGGEYWQWKYVEADGSFPVNDWKLIDGKWYRFDANGYLDVGMREYNGVEYILMRSGAMEANRDYGVGYVDASGAWHLAEVPLDSNYRSNVFFTACSNYGIDIDSIINSCKTSQTFTYSCPLTNIPKDSEGGYVPRVAAYAISNAIVNYADWEEYYTAFHWEFSVDEAANTFNMTFSSNIETGGPIMQ